MATILMFTNVVVVGVFVNLIFLPDAHASSLDDDFRFESQTPTEGHKFVFAFMDDGLQEHEDVTQGPKLTITAPPGSADTVVVNISMPSVEFLERVLIHAGDVAVVQLPYSAIVHGIGVHSNGIVVNASDDVFVYGLAEEERHSRSEGFLAIPVSSLGTEYVAVSLQQKKGNTRRHSEFAVVAVSDMTNITIKAVAEFTYEDRIYEAGMPLTVLLFEYEVLQIKSLNDLTGTKIQASSPVAFLSGVDCGTVKLRHSVRSGCGHMVEQLPPVKAWGRYFIYRPSVGGPSTRQGRHQAEPVNDILTKIKIITNDDTDVLIGTSSGSVETRHEFDVSGSETVHITAFKPVLVVAFILYHGACEKSCKKRTPTMTYIPPLIPGAPNLAFSTVNATDRKENSEMNHYLSILYDCSCFRRFIWGGSQQERVTQAGFAVVTGQICWTQYEVAPGTYFFSTRSVEEADSCFFSAFLRGHGTNGGYAFPIGLSGQGKTERRLEPTTAVGSEFYISFAAYYTGSRRGPKLIIHRAESDGNTTPIRGAINSGPYSLSFTIPIGQESIDIELPRSVILQNSRDESGSPIEIRTWGRVMVYGLHDAFRDKSDAFLALPRPMMGMEYFLIGTWLLSGPYPQQYTIFVVIGLHDDTFVSMKLRGSLSFRNHVYYGGTSVGFTINRSQALFFMSIEDQTGTHVLSSKPISIMSGATCGYSLFPDHESSWSERRCDHMLEHIPPVERWGHQFVASAFRGYDRGDATTFIMASSRRTLVEVNDEDAVRLGRGNFHRVYLSETRGLHTFINASKPVLVYQVPNYRPLNHTSGYSLPSKSIVPSIDDKETKSDFSDFQIPLVGFKISGRNDTMCFANIAAPCSAISNITLIGDTLSPNDWSGPIYSSDFCAIRMWIDNESLLQLNTGGTKLSIVLYGFSSVSGYSCPGNM